MEKYAIYLDLDGVLADYEEGIKSFGFTPDPSLNRSSHLLPGSGSAKKREMYEAVKGTTFYADLPLMPDALQLYNAVYKAKPIILTAAPKFGATEEDYFINPFWLGAAYHKRNWVETVLLPKAAYERKNLFQQAIANLSHDPIDERIRISDERFICTTSSRKYQFMHRKRSDHQILIDDRIDNCEAWREAGGIAFQHTDTSDTISMLQAYMWSVDETEGSDALKS